MLLLLCRTLFTTTSLPLPLRKLLYCGAHLALSTPATPPLQRVILLDLEEDEDGGEEEEEGSMSGDGSEGQGGPAGGDAMEG